VKNEERFGKIDANFDRIFGESDQFPIWGKASRPSFEEKPRLPRLTGAHCVNDYLRFLMEFGPNVQKTFNVFYHQICAISNQIFDQEDKQKGFDDIERTLADLSRLKEQLSEFQVPRSNPGVDDSITELKEFVMKMKRENIVNIIENMRIELDELRSEVARKRSAFKKTTGFVPPPPKQSESDSGEEEGWSLDLVPVSIRGVHSAERVSFLEKGDGVSERKVNPIQQSSRPKSVGFEQEDSLRAVAAVAPRGAASARLIFANIGDGRPTSAGNRWREEIETRRVKRMPKTSNVGITGSNERNFSGRGGG
jgi:hypothetical protein